MSSLALLEINFAVYMLTFIMLIKWTSVNKPIIFVWGLFCLTSFFSIMFYSHPLFSITIHYSKMTVAPFIYLYISLMILIVPLAKFKVNKYRLSSPIKWNISFIKYLLIILFISYLFVIILDFPDVFRNLSGDLSNNRDDVYEKTGRAVITHIFVKNVFYLHFNYVLQAIAYYNIVLCIFFILKFPKLKTISILLIIAIILSMTVKGLVLVSRGPILSMILCLTFIYFIYYKYLNIKVKKVILLFAIISLGLFILIFALISVSRFGEDSEFVSLYLYKYAGESMINFNGLMFDNLRGTCDGKAYFTFFTHSKELYGIAKWDLIEKLTGVSGQYFYTLIGGLLFEFGKVKSFIIICIVGLISLNILKIRYNRITIIQLLFFMFLGKQLIFGVFLFNLQGAVGAYEIIFLIFYILYFNRLKLN